MSPEAQRIAITEACGWTDIKTGPYDGLPFGRRKSHQLEVIPDYLNDLNAMHEAEKLLTQWEELVSYHSWLGYCGGNSTIEVHNCIHATAAQRAEAFLRTIGRWEEEAKP